MREHILDRLVTIANTIMATKAEKERTILAMAAMSLAITHHRCCPPAEGSP